MDDLEKLTKLINELWIKTYGGLPVSDFKALKARVVAIFDDRNNWLDNAKAANKEYLKLEKKLKKYE